jgi:hypothetical protein
MFFSDMQNMSLSPRSPEHAMVRILAVFLLLCLSEHCAFALNINWQKRVQRFSQYVGEQSIAQGQRTKVLEMQSKSFNSRAQTYVRALEARARPFQSEQNP